MPDQSVLTLDSPAESGTCPCGGRLSGAVWHRNNGEQPCRPAMDTQNEYSRRYREKAAMAARRPARRQEGELYGDELRTAVRRHLAEHPVGLTSQDIARAFGYKHPAGGGGQRVLRALWVMYRAGEVTYVTVLRRDGSNRETRHWYATVPA